MKIADDYSRAHQLLVNITQEHQHLKHMENSLLELHQLMADVNILITAQGNTITNIENSVQEAATYTEKGIGQMNKALKKQRKSRKVNFN